MSISSVSSSATSAYQQWLAQIQAQRQKSQQTSQAAGSDLASLFANMVAQIGGGAASTNGVDTDGSGATQGVQVLQGGTNPFQSADPAQIGIQLQQQNPALFKALDANGDGTLSASELSAGRKAIRSAMFQAAQQVGSPGGTTGADSAASGSNLSQPLLAAVTANLQKSDPALATALTDASTGTITAQNLQDAAQTLRMHHHHHHGGGGGQQSDGAGGNGQNAQGSSSSSDPLAALLSAMQSSSTGSGASAVGSSDPWAVLMANLSASSSSTDGQQSFQFNFLSALLQNGGSSGLPTA